jgi:hypothetical protein
MNPLTNNFAKPKRALVLQARDEQGQKATSTARWPEKAENMHFTRKYTTSNKVPTI